MSDTMSSIMSPSFSYYVSYEAKYFLSSESVLQNDNNIEQSAIDYQKAMMDGLKGTASNEEEPLVDQRTTTDSTTTNWEDQESNPSNSLEWAAACHQTNNEGDLEEHEDEEDDGSSNSSCSVHSFEINTSFFNTLSTVPIRKYPPSLDSALSDSPHYSALSVPLDSSVTSTAPVISSSPKPSAVTMIEDPPVIGLLSKRPSSGLNFLDHSYSYQHQQQDSTSPTTSAVESGFESCSSTLQEVEAAAAADVGCDDNRGRINSCNGISSRNNAQSKFYDDNNNQRKLPDQTTKFHDDNNNDQQSDKDNINTKETTSASVEEEQEKSTAAPFAKRNCSAASAFGRSEEDYPGVKFRDNKHRQARNHRETATTDITGPKCHSMPPSTNTAKSSATNSSRLTSIHEELSMLDTALPTFDFEKLEATLNHDAMEREKKMRRVMSEEVRRRLAMDEEEEKAAEQMSNTLWPPAPTTRPNRSNLATRFKYYGHNMQICYMNDESLEFDSSTTPFSNNGMASKYCCDVKTASRNNFRWDEKEREMSKSLSIPSNIIPLRLPGDDDSNVRMTKSISSLPSPFTSCNFHAAGKINRGTSLRDEKEAKLLEIETRAMLMKAEEAAHMQMEVERQQSKSSVGLPAGKRRATRQQLNRMSAPHIRTILNGLLQKIEEMNDELVDRLVDRDNLHMSQDSMLVDIEDLLQHKRADPANFPEFLVQAPPPTTTTVKWDTKFRIFER